MAKQPYDPAARRERYEREKALKGPRGKGPGTIPSTGTSRSSSPPPRRNQNESPSRKNPPPRKEKQPSPAEVKARIGRLKTNIAKLEGALSRSMAELSERRQAARETDKKNSDGKSTAEEKQASKEYREKHKQEIASKRKKESSTSSGGGSSKTSTTSSNSVSDMSLEALESRVRRIKGAISSAKKQLSSANQQLGQLSHSEILSRPHIDQHFARFRLEERNPL